MMMIVASFLSWRTNDFVGTIHDLTACRDCREMLKRCFGGEVSPLSTFLNVFSWLLGFVSEEGLVSQEGRMIAASFLLWRTNDFVGTIHNLTTCRELKRCFGGEVRPLSTFLNVFYCQLSVSLVHVSSVSVCVLPFQNHCSWTTSQGGVSRSQWYVH
jgi:hypothetical protein